MSHPEPGTGESLELDQVDLCELLGRVLVQRPVLLHSSVQCAQLDELGHHSDRWNPLDHQVPRFQVDGVHLTQRMKRMLIRSSTFNYSAKQYSRFQPYSRI